MNIYTRTGDKGETGYIGGRISKSSRMINLLGELDELNSSVGLAVSQFSDFDPRILSEIVRQLEHIQGDLLEIGSVIAQPEMEGEKSRKFLEILPERISQFEQEIDEYENVLSPLTSFILPGGSETGAQLHLTRSVCRRCERVLAKYADDSELAKDYRERLLAVLGYTNRLADWLFVVARFVNMQHGKQESSWSSRL